MKRPIDYIQEAQLENKCGALLTPMAIDAINKMMVLFAREYANWYQSTNATDGYAIIKSFEEFEQLEFNQSLLPKNETPNN